MKNSFWSPRNIVIFIAAVVVLLIGISMYQNKNTKMGDNYAGKTFPTENTGSTSTSISASTTRATTTLPKAAPTTVAPANSDSKSPTNKAFASFSTYSYSAARTSGWSQYANSQYGFSVKYPPTADFRDFIDGAGKSYGLAVTIPQPTGLYSEKYFELTVESVGTTICDAVTGYGNTKVNINGSVFGRTDYKDEAAGTSGPSHVVQYLFKKGSNCYKGYLRLNGPRFTQAALDSNAKAAGISSESQVLEDMMHTFIINR